MIVDRPCSSAYLYIVKETNLFPFFHYYTYIFTRIRQSRARVCVYLIHSILFLVKQTLFQSSRYALRLSRHLRSRDSQSVIPLDSFIHSFFSTRKFCCVKDFLFFFFFPNTFIITLMMMIIYSLFFFFSPHYCFVDF